MNTHNEFSDTFKETYDEEQEDYEENENKHQRIHDMFGPLDPRASWVQDWNRVFLLVCAMGLFIDPFFLYALSLSESCMCVFIDGWFAVTVTMLRCMTDLLHVWNIWLQFKMCSWSHQRLLSTGETKARFVFVAINQFTVDFFAILPIPQVVLWLVIPALLQKGSTTFVMTVLLIMFLFQFLPKIYHFVLVLRRMQSLSGYVFGTVWWGIVLNMIAYFIASHAVGACWYLLGIQRVAQCLKEKCMETNGCKSRILTCDKLMYYGTNRLVKDHTRLLWGENKSARSCLEDTDGYGFLKWTVQLFTNENRLEKMLLPIFWGIMNLSTFGNLEGTTDWLEATFVFVVIALGLLLVTMLIGNIKVFLHTTTSKKLIMQLRMRNLEWWMSKKHLPHRLRQRVRNYERQSWTAMRGVDECEMIRNLPEGLRRDIKYRLCLDLVRQVPLFKHMDNLVLENICDRVKPLIFTKGEIIAREGDPVQRVLFIVRGHLESSQILQDGIRSCCILGPGNFSGDELLSWCLKRPFLGRLPSSSSTIITLETTEAFGLEAEDAKYVTQHFRYTFVNEKVKRSLRYYSPGWRTWAVVTIQLAWRRYKHRLTLTSLSFIRSRRPLSSCSSLGEDRLRLYTALLTTAKPNEDDMPNQNVIEYYDFDDL